MKSAVDDNARNHLINDVEPGTKNNLFCRLIPMSPTHKILGEIDIRDNKIVQIVRGGDRTDNLLLSIY